MKPKKDFSTASLAVIGVDIGKEVFHLVGLAVDGKIAFRKKVRRLGFEDAFEKLPPSIVGMEACLSAHFVSRVLRRTRCPRGSLKIAPNSPAATSIPPQ